MQSEVNFPLLVALFVIALAAIPNDEYVSIEFDGRAFEHGDVEIFIGHVSLSKPHDGPLNGEGHIADPDNPDNRYSFTIKNNLVRIESPDGSVFSEDLSAFSKVYSPSDFMLQVDNTLLNSRGQKVIVQEFDGYQSQTLHERGGGQIQLVTKERSEGNSIVRMASWLIDQGLALHITFSEIGFTQPH